MKIKISLISAFAILILSGCGDLKDVRNSTQTFIPINNKTNDEISLSLTDPNSYIFIINSPLIGNGGLDKAHGSRVRSLHLAIDSDLNKNTGNVMNDLGADYYLASWEVFGSFIGVENTTNWDDRWEWYSKSQVHSSTGKHVVAIKIPRSYLITKNGIIRVASTFNDENNKHFYWTHKYEFNLNHN